MLVEAGLLLLALALAWASGYYYRTTFKPEELINKRRTLLDRVLKR